MKIKNLVGVRFGRLVVEKEDGHIGSKIAWICKCNCGNYARVSTSNLVTNQVLSCGCLGREKRISGNTTHGMTHTKIYKIWDSMKRRCNSPKAERYPRYGGRGITYIVEWNSFEPFYQWALNHGYAEGLSIDRIDNDGNYEPANCRWVEVKEQQNNKSTSFYITYNGETLTAAEWSKKLNIPYFTLYQRIVKLGWSADKALLKI